MQFYFVEYELAGVGVDFYIIAVGEFASLNFSGEGILHVLLNGLLRHKRLFERTKQSKPLVKSVNITTTAFLPVFQLSGPL